MNCQHLTTIKNRRKLPVNNDFAGVAEWQTRWTQNPVAARLCGFKSHLRYSQNLSARNRRKLIEIDRAQN